MMDAYQRGNRDGLLSAAKSVRVLAAGATSSADFWSKKRGGERHEETYRTHAMSLLLTAQRLERMAEALPIDPELS